MGPSIGIVEYVTIATASIYLAVPRPPFERIFYALTQDVQRFSRFKGLNFEFLLTSPNDLLCLLQVLLIQKFGLYELSTPLKSVLKAKNLAAYPYPLHKNRTYPNDGAGRWRMDKGINIKERFFFTLRILTL